MLRLSESIEAPYSLRKAEEKTAADKILIEFILVRIHTYLGYQLELLKLNTALQTETSLCLLKADLLLAKVGAPFHNNNTILLARVPSPCKMQRCHSPG